MKPKILVTGASSYLAHRLIPIASDYADVVGVARQKDSVVRPATPVEFDLIDTHQINDLIEDVRPAAIIHAAAVNPGDGDDLMDTVNHIASARFAEYASAHSIRYVMVSTESVHRGSRAPYSDNAVPDPINTYGRSKSAGEYAVMACNPDAVIVRTSLIYGLEKIDRGTRGFRDRLLSGAPLQLFDDVFRQPIWVDSLSFALCRLALHHVEISGTINIVGSERMSRAEFALVMLKYWGVDTGREIGFRSGVGLRGVQMDLTCTCEKADALGYLRPGVTEVMSNTNRNSDLNRHYSCSGG